MGQWDPNSVGMGRLGFTRDFYFAHRRLSARRWQPFDAGVCRSLPYIPFIINFSLSSFSLISSAFRFSHTTRKYIHFYLIQITDCSLTDLFPHARQAIKPFSAVTSPQTPPLERRSLIPQLSTINLILSLHDSYHMPKRCLVNIDLRKSAPFISP